MRRRQAALVGGPLLGLALGFLIGWSTDPHAAPLGQTLATLSRADVRQGLGDAALVSGMLATVAGVLRAMCRPILAWRLRGYLAERPGVDPRDPVRRSRLCITLAERGFVIDGEGSHTVVAATSVCVVGETPRAFMLMVGRIAGFVVPKRDLASDQLDEFRAVTAAWADADRPEAEPLA